MTEFEIYRQVWTAWTDPVFLTRSNYNFVGLILVNVVHRSQLPKILTGNKRDDNEFQEQIQKKAQKL